MQLAATGWSCLPNVWIPDISSDCSDILGQPIVDVCTTLFKQCCNSLKPELGLSMPVQCQPLFSLGPLHGIIAAVDWWLLSAMLLLLLASRGHGA